MNDLSKSLGLGLVIRLGLIAYGEWHDRNIHVPFTDVDYKVFSDAAWYVSEGESPYKRHTYRYPPILAWLLLPNVLFSCYGKIFFSMIDILTSLLIRELVKSQGFSDLITLRCSQIWIFNPLAIIISTRGNSDSIISLTVLLSVYFLLKQKPVYAGLFLALSIHIRLYPIIFALPMYLSLKSETDNGGGFVERVKTSLKNLYPNRNQIFLAVSCVTHLIMFTGFCYLLYGFEFLQEAILYHLKRKDTRHNFSVYFYLLYISPDQSALLLFLPQLILLLTLSFTYGSRSTLLFCLFTEAFVAVTYNPVLTSQYFVWYLSLLPPNLPRFNMTLFEAGKLTALWLFSQLAWLVPAYFLEFRGRNTFVFIWLQGIGFFCANVAVLVKLIKRYRLKTESAKGVKND